jgi:hypothetical protein
MTNEERERIEGECLEETRRALKWLTPDDPTRVHEAKLEGSYPDTRIVVTGEHTYGGSWRVRFPIWDPGTGGTRDGEPMPSFIGTLVYTEVLEA